jgi:hypothetical protein
MEYYDQEYLNLFKQIKEQKTETKDYTFEQLRGNATNLNNYQMLKETPNYTNYNNINEVQRNPYSQEMNLNEFNIETRINGMNINEVKRQDKENRLNEVMENLRLERLKSQENQNLNETINFKDTDVVSLEMFEKARFNSMMVVAKRILPK